MVQYICVYIDVEVEIVSVSRFMDGNKSNEMINKTITKRYNFQTDGRLFKNI